jgi:hypothetical protein
MLDTFKFSFSFLLNLKEEMRNQCLIFRQTDTKDFLAFTLYPDGSGGIQTLSRRMISQVFYHYATRSQPIE